jgi:hypothetical protein
MLIIYSKFGKFRNLPYICIIKVKQVVTIKKYKIMKTEKIYIIEFRNSEGERGAQCYRATTINKAFEIARKHCKATCVELIGVREA